MRRALARKSFNKKIRKVAQLIQLSAGVKRNRGNDDFNGARLSESVLARDWNPPEDDAAWKNL